MSEQNFTLDSNMVRRDALTTNLKPDTQVLGWSRVPEQKLRRCMHRWVSLTRQFVTCSRVLRDEVLRPQAGALWVRAREREFQRGCSQNGNPTSLPSDGLAGPSRVRPLLIFFLAMWEGCECRRFDERVRLRAADLPRQMEIHLWCRCHHFLTSISFIFTGPAYKMHSFPIGF